MWVIQNQEAGPNVTLGHTLLTSMLTRELSAKRAVKEAKSWEEKAEKGFTEEMTSAQRINGCLSWFGREKGKYFYDTSNEQR